VYFNFELKIVYRDTKLFTSFLQNINTIDTVFDHLGFEEECNVINNNRYEVIN